MQIPCVDRFRVAGSLVLLSGWRESDPRLNLGRIARYHYATPAMIASLDDVPFDRPPVDLAHPAAQPEITQMREGLGEREALLVR
jgi:hypothetical protein